MPDSPSPVDWKWSTRCSSAKLTHAGTAARYELSVPTVRKWIGRYLTQGEPGLRDGSSRPQRSPRAISSSTALAIVELRRRYLTQARIAHSLGVSESTVSRVLARAGLSRWSDLAPSEPVVRYEHAHPGDLLHIDTKKLGRIVRRGHRVTGDPRDRCDGAGWEYLFVAVDDHARIGFTQMYPDEGGDSAATFLRASAEYFAGLGVTTRRVLTDNGSGFRSIAFATTSRQLQVRHVFTGLIGHRPMAKLSASFSRRCASGPMAFPMSSKERTAMLKRWNHHYNWHRPRQGIGGVAPMSRRARSRNNLLKLHN